MNKKTLSKFMNLGHVLGRAEMRKIMAGCGGGGSCLITCCGCENDLCQGWADSCDVGAIEICGPGYYGVPPCYDCRCA